MRSKKLDSARGIAILGMIFFHANYLLIHLFENSTLNFSPIFWFILGKAVVSLFIFVSGISLFLFTRDKTFGEVLRFSWKRAVLLSGIAGIISLVTFSFLRKQGIVFGIIHFFALSSFLFPFFVRFGRMNILLGSLIVATGVFFNSILVTNNLFAFLGLRNAHFFSADYYPLFPWFGLFLIAFGLAKWLDEKDWLDGLLGGEVWWATNSLIILGRNSLALYLLHVPVLYVIFFLAIR